MGAAFKEIPIIFLKDPFIALDGPLSLASIKDATFVKSDTGSSDSVMALMRSRISSKDRMVYHKVTHFILAGFVQCFQPRG